MSFILSYTNISTLVCLADGWGLFTPCPESQRQRILLVVAGPRYSSEGLFAALEDIRDHARFPHVSRPRL